MTENTNETRDDISGGENFGKHGSAVAGIIDAALDVVAKKNLNPIMFTSILMVRSIQILNEIGTQNELVDLLEALTDDVKNGRESGASSEVCAIISVMTIAVMIRTAQEGNSPAEAG